MSSQGIDSRLLRVQPERSDSRCLSDGTTERVAELKYIDDDYAGGDDLADLIEELTT